MQNVSSTYCRFEGHIKRPSTPAMTDLWHNFLVLPTYLLIYVLCHDKLVTLPNKCLFIYSLIYLYLFLFTFSPLSAGEVHDFINHFFQMYTGITHLFKKCHFYEKDLYQHRSHIKNEKTITTNIQEKLLSVLRLKNNLLYLSRCQRSRLVMFCVWCGRLEMTMLYLTAQPHLCFSRTATLKLWTLSKLKSYVPAITASHNDNLTQERFH